jgi:nucleoside-diphosphate-sugar epimerase
LHYEPKGFDHRDDRSVEAVIHFYHLATNVTPRIGYVGGHVLEVLTQKHPDYQIVSLVRTEQQATIIKSAHPNVETVIGILDDSSVLEAEAAKADAILSTYNLLCMNYFNTVVDLASADHIAGAVSLIEGMAKGPNKNATLIHISGTGIMTDMSNGPGNSAQKVYHDMDPTDIQEILSFDESHIHRDVEAAVVAAAAQYGVETAILSPPMIHGIGKGPLKQRSIQVPILIECILNRGKAFQVLEGSNIWNSIHIDNVATGVIVLLEEALKGSKGNAVWLPDGYYFVEDAEFVRLSFLSETTY